MPPGSKPAEPPDREPPSEAWQHFALYKNVRDAISALPAYFRTETHIAGIMATDLHTLNTALGATIEEQVVNTLNAMRMVWDPDERYALYSFIRQPQTFPDVLLRRASDGDVLLGIELKGWYLLAKEGEPSFRYQVTPAACNVQDLIVVVPWALAQVISGSPIVFDPYIELARYASQYRNYHWTVLRKAKDDPTIKVSAAASPYPKKSDQISDVPLADKGNNFGRFARTGIMDAYIQQMMDRLLCGVRVRYWNLFFKAFLPGHSEDEIYEQVEAVARQISSDDK